MSFLKHKLVTSLELKKKLLNDSLFLSEFEALGEAIVHSYKNQGRLYIAGNGGSAADAQHLAAELVGRYQRERRPFAAEALSTDTSLMTAIGNDYGYEWVFARQLMAKARKNDVFLAISTSGNSPNILKACEIGYELGVSVVGLTGHLGGKLKSLTSPCVIVPSSETSLIQETHMMVYHSLCQFIEESLCPELSSSIKKLSNTHEGDRFL